MNYKENEILTRFNEKGVWPTDGEPISHGKYIVNKDIYDLEGEIVINSGEVIDFKEDTQPIMGYDVFKYNNVFLTIYQIIVVSLHGK